MTNQQLLDFIRQQLSAGLTKEKITSDLLVNGWTAQDIEEGFRALIPFAVPTPPSSQPQNQSNILNKNIDAPQDELLKARHFRHRALVLGLISPIVFAVLFLLAILGIVLSGGFGALGIATAFSLDVPMLLLIISIPCGIISSIFGYKAIMSVRQCKVSKFPYFLVASLGLIEILLSIFILWKVTPWNSTCLFNHYPGNGGCLHVAFIPDSLQQDDSNNPKVPFTESGAEQVAKNNLGANYVITKVTENSKGWIFDYSSKTDPTVVDIWSSKYGASGEGPIFVDKNSQNFMFVNSHTIDPTSVSYNNCKNETESTTKTKDDINILSPKGGEIWNAGETHDVIWDSTSKLKGQTITIIAENGINNPAVSQFAIPISNGKYEWKIPNGILPGGYFLNIFTNTGNKSVYSNCFTINNSQPTTPTIKLLSSGANEKWEVGTTHTITWQQDCPLLSDTCAPRLYDVSLVNVRTQETQSLVKSISTYSYNWNIPNFLSVGVYYIQVCQENSVICGSALSALTIVSGQ